MNFLWVFCFAVLSGQLFLKRLEKAKLAIGEVKGLIAVYELASILQAVLTLTDECQEMECELLLMNMEIEKGVCCQCQYLECCIEMRN